MGQDGDELICENARKTRQNQAIAAWTLLSTKPEWFLTKASKKWFFCHFCIFGSVKALMVTLGYWAKIWLCCLPGRLMQHCWDKKGSLWCPVIFLNIKYDQNIANVDLKLIRPHQDSNWPTVGGGVRGGVWQKTIRNTDFFWTPSLSQMCFEYQGIIFNGFKVLKFSQMLRSGPGGLTNSTHSV